MNIIKFGMEKKNANKIILKLKEYKLLVYNLSTFNNEKTSFCLLKNHNQNILFCSFIGCLV